MIDQLIRAIYDFTTTQLYPLANPSEAEKIALVAVGGYGRAELAPYSDIDLLFLLPYKLTSHCEQVVEYILYRLWDLGLKVGQSARSIEECLARAKGDLTIKTALLEARYLWGEQALFDKFRKRFQKECVAGQGEAFYQAKLNERKVRHERFGPSRYALEPNIKEGKGGLRDLQTLRWIGRFLYNAETTDKLVEEGVLTPDAAHRFDKAEAYLWLLRCHLHFLRERGEDKLTFDIQLEIARRLGYRDHAGNNAVERLMKHYFLTAKSVGELTRFFCTAVEAQHVKRSFIRLPSIGLRKRELEGFGLDGGRLSVPNAKHFDKHPLDLLRIFRVAQKHDLDIQPMTFTWIADKSQADRQGLSRESGSQRDLHEGPDLALQGAGGGGAPHERSRRVRALRPRLRPGGGADAVRHVPPFHGRRAHHLCARHPAQDRDRRAVGRGADRDPGGARDPVAARALCRGAAARHRQGPQRRPFGAGRGAGGAAVPAPRLHRGPDRDGGVAGAPSPADVEHRVQARPRRSRHHRDLCRPGAVDGAPPAIAGADGRRHPRGRARRPGTAGRRSCCATSSTAPRSISPAA